MMNFDKIAGMKEKLMDDLLEISKSVGLPFKKILDFVYALRLGGVDNNTLIERVGVSRNALNQVKMHLGGYLAPTSKETVLSDEGREVISGLFPPEFAYEEKMWEFFEANPGFNQINTILECNSRYRAVPERKFDQFNATTQTTARRAVLMNFFEDIQKKRIMCLGDDDFVSIGVASYNTARRIQVLDIDNRILEGVKGASVKEGYQVDCSEYDARKDLPREFLHGFDVVFTDPPYTTEGISLFVSRAIAALDPKNKAARLYLCYGNSDRAKERFLPVYEALISSGLMIRWVFDKFNRYQGAESIGNASTLFVCDVTSKTKPIIHGEYTGQIYTIND